MYEWVSERLESGGFQQYEISNWSKPGLECRHNLQYWRGLPYIAAGAGAHGYVNGYRYSNVLRIKTYIDRLNDNQESQIVNRESSRFPTPTSQSPALEFPLTPATVNQHRQTQRDDMNEFMMTGLRLTREGVSAGTFRERFGQEMVEVFGKEIEELIKVELLEWQSERLQLTRRGRLLGNQVFMRFID
jgi:oxygen-independent coproporphyrinogen-3 oxidase